MCDALASPLPASAPRWNLLYAILGGTLCGLALSALPPSSAVRLALGSASAVMTLGALRWWLVANRAALDLASWCDCASSTVTIRIIGASVPRARGDSRLRLGDSQGLADHQAARE